MTVQFWYVRHGETLFNCKGRVQGVCDTPLTALGIEQAQRAADKLKDQAFDRVFVSPSGRAQETASYLLHGRQAPMEILEDLHEMDFGRMEGSRMTSHMEELRKCYKEADFSYEGGESGSQVESRIDHAFQMIRERCKDGDRVLIVGHGMYERFIMAHLLGVDFIQFEEEREKERRNGVPNASIMTFSYENGRYQIDQMPLEPERFQPIKVKKTVHFYFVRHGETLFNVWSRMQGVADSPLTQNGIHQAVVTADALSDIPFNRIYTSPLRRAYRTAEIIAAKHPNVKLEPCKNLEEVAVGDFEGVVTNDWQAEFKERHRVKGWADVGGESIEDVAMRIHEAMHYFVAQANDGDNVMLISHGNYYVNVLQNLFHISRDDLFNHAREEGKQATPNGGIARFDWNGDHFELVHLMMTPEEFWNHKRD